MALQALYCNFPVIANDLQLEISSREAVGERRSRYMAAVGQEVYRRRISRAASSIVSVPMT